MRNRLLISIGFVFVFNLIVSAQGYMSSPGYSGTNLQLRMLENRHSQSYEIMPGYTFAGRFSLSFGLGYTHFNLSDASGFSFSQKISGLILKQSEKMPLSLGVNIEFQKGSVDTEIPTEDNPISQFSFSLHHAYRGIRKMQFIPNVEVGTRQEIRFDGKDYAPYSDYFAAVSLTFGYTYFYIEPKVLLHDEMKLFQLSAGVFL